MKLNERLPHLSARSGIGQRSPMSTRPTESADSTAASDPLLKEPTRPGTSAKYLGGRPYYG